MALTLPSLPPLKPIITSYSMEGRTPEFRGDATMESVEKKLEREQSVGNRIYRTITPEWFEANHDWIDKFLDNADDPELLDELEHPANIEEGQASAQMTPIQDFSISNFQNNPFNAANAPAFPAIPIPAHSTGSSHQYSPQLMTHSVSHSPEPMSMAHSLPQPGTGKSGMGLHGSPEIEQVETPPRITGRASSRSLRATPRQLSRPESAPLPGTSVESRQYSGEVQGNFISLIDKAASLGAPHKALAARRAQSQTTRSLDISENLSQSSEALGEAAEGLSINEDDEPRRRGPGRKKRTEWVHVLTEEGEYKWVSPQEYRKLRRRITNRMSARRMRKKHADEKNQIQDVQAELQKKLDERESALEDTEASKQELKAIAESMRAERDHWRNEYLKLADRYQQVADRLSQFMQQSAQMMQSGLPGSLQMNQGTIHLHPAANEEAMMRNFEPSYEPQQAMHSSMGMQPLTPMQAQMQTQIQATSHSPMHLSEAERHHRREASFGNVLPARRPFESSPMAQYQFNPHQVDPRNLQQYSVNPESLLRGPESMNTESEFFQQPSFEPKFDPSKFDPANFQ